MNLSSINAVIWDFDGVFFVHDSVPCKQWDSLTLDTNAHAACSVIKGLSFKDAVDLTLASGKNYGEGFSGFVPLARAQGLSRDELIRRMNQKYHEIMFKKVQKHFPDPQLFCFQDRVLTNTFCDLVSFGKPGLR